MKPGELVGDRFDLEREAGAGGMSTVWRARDRRTGEVVALKVLRPNPRLPVARFEREGELLASFEHPGIVRYVAHGGTAAGRLFIALEWLDGEDLEARLARGRLTVAESLSLVARVADALGAAHARGIVHRDIKPSNVFLVEGDLEYAKLLDFGVARLQSETRPSTLTGAAIGTPGYMAPEQARGAREIDARADVFSLGCVLFECLTGRMAFVGDQPLAILAKILFDEPPRLRDLLPGAPRPLDRLLGRMLAKDVDQRPSDGHAIATELADVAASAAGSASTLPPPAITGGERRRMSVLLLADVGGSAWSTLPPGRDTDRTVRRGDGALAALGDVTEGHGGNLELLLDGSAVVTLPGTGAATDQAARAGALALELRSLAPDAPMTLATGRAELGSQGTVGEVIERAAALLMLARPVARASSEAEGTPPMVPIRLDGVTAGLLGARFEISGDDEGLLLLGPRSDEAPRTLLGRETPLVGRERDMNVIQMLFAQCVDERAAGAVVVLGPAGVGKSRLRQEFVRRVRARGDEVEIWAARGEAIRAGSSFALAAELLQGIAGLVGNEPPAVRRKKLEARLGRHLAGDDLARVAEFLGEIAGVPFPDDASLPLRAARQDAQLMGDQIRRAWEDFIAAECDAQPVLVVLEDLHHGDLPSIQLVDAALRMCFEKPLMLLAFGRPEVGELFPGLWSERSLQRIQLGPLGRRASESLALSVLPEAKAETVARLVETAGGNAFYLEELIRAVAEGSGDALPETVLAMVEARLESLGPDGRRLLRAASVFGQVFWGGGVGALLGGGTAQADDAAPAPPAVVTAWIEELLRREVLTVRPETRFAGEREYAFRHALIREAVYETLTERDLELGHRLAADWLEQRGETDAMVLAEHFERGALPARAVTWFRRAAEQALEGNDLGAALTRARHAIACGASGETLGALERLRAEAHRWRGENDEAEQSATRALSLLPSGSPTWCAAVAEVAIIRHRLGQRERIVEIGRELLTAIAAGARRRAPTAAVIAASRISTVLLHAGETALGDDLLAACEPDEGETMDVLARAHLLRGRGWRALLRDDPAACIELLRDAASAFDETGDARSACSQRGNLGFALNELGAYAEAERALSGALAAASRLGLAGVVAASRHNLGWALARLGRLDEARALEEEAARAFRAQGDRRMESGCRVYLASIAALAGDALVAEREAKRAVEVAEGTAAPVRARAFALLAQVLLGAGRPDLALEHARAAMALFDAAGRLEEGEALVRLVFAEALHAAGDLDGARGAIGGARDRLLERAAAIGDAWRSSFLMNVPEHARTLELFDAWTEP